MLVRALLQTSLVLWLAQQTLQGGVKPQSVSWGRVLPARGVGIGVKPGVSGALGALGSRYGSKAMKTGIGRYPGAQLGVGGYRALGLGNRAGLKPGGYGTQGAYGASLGTGMGLGAGLTNGLGVSLGQGGKRGYGAGLGTLPGYGSLAGIGYPGARPGVSTADLGGLEMANQGQTLQDLKREKSRKLGLLDGKGDRAAGLETPSMRRTSILGATAPESQTEIGFRPAVLPSGREIKSLDPFVKSSSLGPMMALDKQSKGLAVSQAQVGENNEPVVSERRGMASMLTAGGVGQQLPLVKDNLRGLGSVFSEVQRARDYDSSSQQNQRAKNCGSRSDLLDVLKINRHGLLGSETQRSLSLKPQPHVSKDNKHLAKDFGLVAKDMNGPRIRGTVSVQNPHHGSQDLQQGGSYGPVIPGVSGAQRLGIASVEGQEGKGLTADGQEAKHLSQAERQTTRPKALSIPGQTGRKTQVPSYIGGTGNYLGASLGAGGYGAGLGQGAYLGGAAGKLGTAAALGQGGYPQGAAGMSTGYGDGATGYLGAMAGNGFGGDAGAKALSAGYGNGYSDGYGAGLGYPAELADGAESKAGKREALSTGAYAGQVQGAYGTLGAGLEPTGGKYGGGAAQVPYGNAPVIPTGLEGDGGYPYPAQQLALGAEGAKTPNKYAGAGYGAQQTGYGAQLGATQDALGEQAGKYGGVNDALGNGYKG
uniref:fibroin heavy chain isoform X2 n=1 Tax=Scatophagus argus TaxID=75038 RepID=UPI001ED84661|nr:fibroin heavy chain isoform X2 [Scatophagus argus]